MRAFHFNFYKKNIINPQNYLSFPSGKSFLKQMLFNSLYKVSIGFGGTVFFLKWCWRDMPEWGTKKFRGGSTMDDAMPSSPSSALFSCALTYSFLYFTFNNRHIGLSGFTVFILLRWFGKTRVPSCQIRVTSCELKA